MIQGNSSVLLILQGARLNVCRDQEVQFKLLLFFKLTIVMCEENIENTLLT